VKPLSHQLKYSKLVFDMLRQRKYCLLLGEIRSGKTLTALLALSYSKSIKRILILTKKAAISGITKFIDDPELQAYWSHQTHTVTNYESIGRFVQRTTSKSGKPLAKPVTEPAFKLNPDDYDLLVVDECHLLGKLGKPSQRYKLLKLLAQDKPWLAMSGTAYVESPNQIYYETTFSTKTPFPEKSFYEFHRKWGVPSEIKVGYNQVVADYKLAKPELLTYIDSFSVKMTQADADIKVKSQDQLHYVKPSSGTQKLYNKLLEDRIANTPHGLIVADTIMALRTQLHQIEGGTIKIDTDYYDLNLNDKVNYIKQVWGDHADLGIMAYYKAEYDLLTSHFKHAQIYSSIRHAEGVNLAHLKNFVVYSFGFSGSKFIQLRDRITNVDGSNTSTVHILLSTNNAISNQAYEAVASKRDFNNKVFKQQRI
jgi:hypothetical protein